MNRIPEIFIRRCAFKSALPCWGLFGAVFAAQLLGVGLGLTVRWLGGSNAWPFSVAETIIATFLVLLALEALVYWLFLRKRFAQKDAEALQDLAASINDPAQLARITRASQGSDAYYELLIKGYQDFTVGLGYTAVFLFFPGLILGLPLGLLACIPFAAAEAFGALPEGSAIIIALVLGQIIAAPLWYRFGFYRFFRRGRIKALRKGMPTEIQAPRPGPYK
jgi:hypothetical protein